MTAAIANNEALAPPQRWATRAVAVNSSTIALNFPRIGAACLAGSAARSFAPNRFAIVHDGDSQEAGIPARTLRIMAIVHDGMNQQAGILARTFQ